LEVDVLAPYLNETTRFVRNDTFCPKRRRFMLFKKKKQNSVVWATLFLFLLPLDVQQGKIEIVVFPIYFLPACFCQNSKPHTRPLMMRNWGSRAHQPTRRYPAPHAQQ
jgi:hypothetical protein